MIEKHYANVTQTARELGIARMTVYRWLKAGRLTAEKPGREVLIPRWLVELEKEKKK